MKAKRLALILARGGSKRIPSKNIRPFQGRPIIEYSIEAARNSALFDDIVVSTDSVEIARIAEAAGASIPFQRPAELANDRSLPIDGVIHALNELERMGRTYDMLCLITATAPFLRVDDLFRGAELVGRDGVECAFAVTEFAFPIMRALKINDEGSVEMLWPEHETTLSNDLPPAYHDAGQFYWITIEAIRREHRVYIAGARPLILPRWRVLDIDTEDDWEHAEKLYAVALGRQ